MMRKFTYYVLAFFAIFFVNGCNEEDVSTPPSATFTVDKTSGLSDQTEFTFTVNQVGSNSISILPYGLDNMSLGGILITSFTDGKAVVKFTYAEVGTFQAVVVTSNYSTDGEQIKRSYSATQAITITSDKSEMTAFEFEKISTKTTIDKTAKTIAVIVPFGTDVTKLKAKFETSNFADVSVGGAAQSSNTTENSFVSPVTYKVTADNATSFTNYVVTVTVTPMETDATIKSFQAKSIGTATKGKVYPAYVDNAGKRIVVTLVDGTSDDDKDSLRVSYTMNGNFGKIKTGTTSTTLKQDSLLNLKPVSGFPVSTVTEDSVINSHRDSYSLKAAVAPKLELTFGQLIPVVDGKTTGFDIALNVLTGTDVSAIATSVQLSGGAAGITSSVTKVNGVAFTNGADVNYSKPAVFTVSVNDPNVGVYEATFTATVTVLK